MQKIWFLALIACIGGVVLVSTGEVIAQENILLHPKKFYRKYFPKLKIKRDLPDSAFIKVYPNYLAVGVHALSPAVKMDILSKSSNPLSAAHTLKLRTSHADILGASVSYRFVTAGFSLLVNRASSHGNYARSHYRTATIKYNSGAYALQFKYIRWSGFTDINVNNSADTRYIKRPNMVSKEFQFEALYNFSWRRYSHLAPVTFSQRQVRSHAGILLKAGVYYNQLSDKSSLLADPQKPYFDQFDDINTLRTFSVKLAPGVGGTFVLFKRMFFSATLFGSPDLYFYSYLDSTNTKVVERKSIVYVFDGKASFGYQSKRLYACLRYEAEKRRAALQSIKTNSIYSYLGFEVGYRFDAPRVVKTVYKETMPPGM